MFIDKDTAPLAARMLRARVRIQSQGNADKLRAMLAELNDPDPTPFYTQMLREAPRSLRAALKHRDELLIPR